MPTKQGAKQPESKKARVIGLLLGGNSVARVARDCGTSRHYVENLARELGVGVPCEPKRCRECGGRVVTDPCTLCTLRRRAAIQQGTKQRAQ